MVKRFRRLKLLRRVGSDHGAGWGFRMLRKLLFCLAMLVVAGPAAADDAMRCAREAGDVRIAACTRAINSGAGRPSINYNNRGRSPTAAKATRTVPLPTSPRRYG